MCFEWQYYYKIWKRNGYKIIENEKLKIENSNGWWNTIEAADLDNDGDLDFVVGNHGLNSRFKTYKNYPVSMFINDFDQNGMAEQILCAYNTDTIYPFALRQDLVMSLPYLKKRYLKFEDYQQQTINDIFTKEQLENAIKLEANEMRTGVLMNENGQLIFKALPVEAQFTSIRAIEILDVDADGSQDILLGGNVYRVKPEVGRYDASYGLLLKGNGKGDFKSVKSSDSGLLINGEIRDFLKINNQIFIAKNNSELEVINIK